MLVVMSVTGRVWTAIASDGCKVMFSCLRNPCCISMERTEFSTSLEINEELIYSLCQVLSKTEKLECSWIFSSFPTLIALLSIRTDGCIRPLPLEIAKQDRKEFLRISNMYIVTLCFSNQTSITSLKVMFIVILVSLIADASLEQRQSPGGVL